MRAYRVTVTQSMFRRDADPGFNWVDASFTQYVATLSQAASIVKGFDCPVEEEKNYRRVSNIAIETIHIDGV